MKTFYSDIDPKACAWMQSLIEAGEISPGTVDARSISDVKPDEIVGFDRCHFFAGIAGWDLALKLAGWPEGREVWTGSCPCQPFSCAGKGKGEADHRHLWPEFFRLISARRPSVVFGEQVASAAGLGWLDGVFADLESQGYACWAEDRCAAGVGAPHIRQRLYWLAYTECGTTERQRLDMAAAPQGVPGETRERQRVRHDSGDGKLDGPGLAYLHGERREGIDALLQPGGPQQNSLEVAGSGSRGPGLADLPRRGLGEQRREDRTGNRGHADGGGENGGLVNPQHSQHGSGVGCGEGRAGQRGNRSAVAGDAGGGMELSAWIGSAAGVAGQVERNEGNAGISNHTGHQVSGWSIFDLAYCTDRGGCWRRIAPRDAQPGTFPLAHGVPRNVGHLLAALEQLGNCPADSSRIVREARGYRTARLRGYGNAIVPVLAAQFIRDFLDAEEEANRSEP